MTIDWTAWTNFAIALGIAAVVEGVLVLVVRWTTRLVRRRHPKLVGEYAKPERRLLVLTGVLLLQVVQATAWPHHTSHGVVRHVLVLATVAAAAWFLTSVVSATVETIRLRHPIDGDDDDSARRLHTQLTLIRSFLVTTIWLLAVGFGFFTIPGAEAVGTSILASAGVASVVAGIAAQSLLGNVFAGLQLAFSGSVRVGDLVVADEQTGRVEAVTLTTVAVALWDGRRLVLPSTYFTTHPFENWTQGGSELLGVVQLDVDWRISPAAMREQLTKILSSAPLWDGRSSGLTVEDATGGNVRMRALVSAEDSTKLLDLRSQVREELVEWVASQAKEALPVQRTLQESPAMEPLPKQSSSA